MDFNIKTGQPEKQSTNCLVVPVFESDNLPETTAQLDKSIDGLIQNLIKIGDMQGKVGQTLIMHNIPSIASERILLVGCGKEKDLNDSIFRDIISKMITALNNTGAREAVCYLTELAIPERDAAWKVQQAIVACHSTQYVFDAYKSSAEKKKKSPRSLKKITWMVANSRDLNKAEPAIRIADAIGNSMHLIKDLANTPANICTPSYLAKAAQDLAKTYKTVSTAVLERKDMQALKMGSLLSVAQGSAQPPKLITLEYRGADKTQQPVVIVGKGITFDTGGNSLKAPANMIGMKYDMCGAATVLGAIKFAAQAELPINLVGVLAAAENMPGGEASRPDDIVTSMSGITIEILNTDAEGRLVLCDALTYCERFNPKVVIDVATLTGACVVALGNHHSGLFSNNQALADDLLAAGRLSGDKCWQMPITDEYQKQLDSNFADLANVGGPDAGSITAACFLARFTKKYHWAHLDVAGTACKFVGKEKGATGQPLPLLAEYLLSKCK